jgi:hypothetical protein
MGRGDLRSLSGASIREKEAIRPCAAQPNRWRRKEAYREKQEHSALRVVFLLDDFVTGDESSLERLLGPTPRHGNRVCTHQRQTFQEKGCGIAAALFRWAWCGPAKHSMVPKASGYQLGTS